MFPICSVLCHPDPLFKLLTSQNLTWVLGLCPLFNLVSVLDQRLFVRKKKTPLTTATVGVFVGHITPTEWYISLADCVGFKSRILPVKLSFIAYHVSIHYPTSTLLLSCYPNSTVQHVFSLLVQWLTDCSTDAKTEEFNTDNLIYVDCRGVFAFFKIFFLHLFKNRPPFTHRQTVAVLLHRQDCCFFPLILSAEHTILWVLSVFQPNIQSLLSPFLFGFVHLPKVRKRRKQGDRDRTCIKGHEPAFNPIRH